MFASNELTIKNNLNDLGIKRLTMIDCLNVIKEQSEKCNKFFNTLSDQKQSSRFSLDRELIIESTLINEQIQKIDSFLWDLVLKESGIFNIVSNDLKIKLEDKFNYYNIESKRKRLDSGEYDLHVPIFSPQTASEVIDELSLNLASIRTASVVEIFKKLNSALYIRDRNNRNSWEQQSKLKIEKEMRFNYLTNLTTEKWPSFHSWTNERYGNVKLFGDLENILRMIDKKENLIIEKRICSSMLDFFYKEKYETTKFPLKFENEYFNITIFKKGTIFLKFTNDKILNEFNKIANNGKNLA